MWLPSSAAELERVVEAGELEEGPALDVKRELPTAKRNSDLAVDVAAMALAGGVLIYGVDEDENGAPTELAPIELEGAAERIDQVVRSLVAEVPEIRVQVLRREGDSSAGYLVVEVPPSPRAPHQVQAKGTFRFYGRGAMGNRVLMEDEVARLYRLRERREVDREALLSEWVGEREPPASQGEMYAFARPAAFEGDFWNRIEPNSSALLHEIERIGGAAAATGPRTGYAPGLRTLAGWSRRGGDAFAVHAGDREEGSTGRLLCELRMDGSARLVCLRAAERRPAHHPGGHEPLVLFEGIVAGNLASFFAVAAAYYEAGGYRGAVDVGVRLIGIEGAVASLRLQDFEQMSYPFEASAYTRTAQLGAGIEDPEGAARDLLGRLFDSMVGAGYDPFA